MLNIQIENQEVEEFLQNEFHGDLKSLVNDFTEYIKHQKIKNDVKVSISEIERGECLEVDSAFEEVLSQYEN